MGLEATGPVKTPSVKVGTARHRRPGRFNRTTTLTVRGVLVKLYNGGQLVKC